MRGISRNRERTACGAVTHALALWWIATASGACASTNVTVRTLQPAFWTLTPVEQTLAVVVDGVADGEGAAEIRARLEQAIQRGGNPSIRIGTSATMVLHVIVHHDDYFEFLDHRSATYGRGFRTIEVPEGRATSVIEFRLELPNGERVLETVLDGYGDEDYPRGRVALRELRTRVVDRFVPYLEPSVSRTPIAFSRCLFDRRCRRGIAAIEHGDLAGAERAFGEVVRDAAPRAQSWSGRVRASAAYRDRALVRALRQRFGAAQRDLARAEELRRTDPATEVASHRVEALRWAALSLLAQGVVDNP